MTTDSCSSVITKCLMGDDDQNSIKNSWVTDNYCPISLLNSCLQIPDNGNPDQGSVNDYNYNLISNDLVTSKLMTKVVFPLIQSSSHTTISPDDAIFLERVYSFCRGEIREDSNISSGFSLGICGKALHKLCSFDYNLYTDTDLIKRPWVRNYCGCFTPTPSYYKNIKDGPQGSNYPATGSIELQICNPICLVGTSPESGPIQQGQLVSSFPGQTSTVMCTIGTPSSNSPSDTPGAFTLYLNYETESTIKIYFLPPSENILTQGFYRVTRGHGQPVFMTLANPDGNEFEILNPSNSDRIVEIISDTPTNPPYPPKDSILDIFVPKILSTTPDIVTFERIEGPQFPRNLECTGSVCIIDDVTIKIINSGTKVNLSSFCDGCGAGKVCTCIIQGANSDDISSTVGNKFNSDIKNNFTSYCGPTESKCIVGNTKFDIGSCCNIFNCDEGSKNIFGVSGNNIYVILFIGIIVTIIIVFLIIRKLVIYNKYKE